MFESNGNQLTATLALPPNDKAVGMAVFISGDGPIDADNQDIGYWPIWEAFADAGWASLSWDKPGVGGSSGNWLDQGRYLTTTQLASNNAPDELRRSVLAANKSGPNLLIAAIFVPRNIFAAGLLLDLRNFAAAHGNC